jgi:hypothetical protein
MTFDLIKQLFGNKQKRKNPRFKWYVVDAAKNGAKYVEDIHVTRDLKGTILSGPFSYREEARQDKKRICKEMQLTYMFNGD